MGNNFTGLCRLARTTPRPCRKRLAPRPSPLVVLEASGLELSLLHNRRLQASGRLPPMLDDEVKVSGWSLTSHELRSMEADRRRRDLLQQQRAQREAPAKAVQEQAAKAAKNLFKAWKVKFLKAQKDAYEKAQAAALPGLLAHKRLSRELRAVMLDNERRLQAMVGRPTPQSPKRRRLV